VKDKVVADNSDGINVQQESRSRRWSQYQINITEEFIQGGNHVVKNKQVLDEEGVCALSEQQTGIDTNTFLDVKVSTVTYLKAKLQNFILAKKPF